MLKQLVFLTISLFSIAAMAELKVVKDYGDTVSAAPYTKDIAIPNTKELMQNINDQKEELKKIHFDLNKLLYPNKSDFTQGVVKKRKLFKSQPAMSPFFIIGSDAQSVKWAKKNAQYLKKIHAIGMITNVDTAQEAQHVEKETGLHLIAANINGLNDLIDEKHYPFLIYNKWIVQ